MSKTPNSPFRIGIDLMGSSLSPSALLRALCSIPQDPSIELCPIGTNDLTGISPFCFYQASESIEMDESPISAMKNKKDASMFVGFRLLKKKKIDALISAGSTPALVLGGKKILSMVPGAKRPALFSFFPTKKNPVAVLDLGANVECKALNYVQFAYMASALLHARGIAKPRIGLLNIGEEPTKGTLELRKAYKNLKEFPNPPFEFIGNMEGRSVFEGDIDALITDGFSGNIFLKTAEGITSLILDRLSASEGAKLTPFLPHLEKELCYTESQGALLLGLNGIVVKSHGDSDEKTFINAVQRGISFVKKDFLNSFTKQLKHLENC